MGQTHQKISLIAEVEGHKVVVIQDLPLLLTEAVRRNPHGEAVVSLHQPHGIPSQSLPAVKREPHDIYHCLP